ncbi:MAG: hypothetical protein KC613_27805, partial [Myxococcales bacterium]|nr:hypothetical protein [Myxococcales bacterium]
CEGADGLRVGPWARWHPNGAPAAQASYVNGRREGPFEAWYPMGPTRVKGNFKAGQRVGTWAYFDGGGWKREGAIEADRFEGPWTVTDDQGRKRAEGSYKAGARDGRWVWYGADGGASAGSYDQGRFLMCDGDCPLLQPQIEIEEALKGLEVESARCYREARKVQPELAGSVELHWQVDPAGGTADVKVAGGSLPPGPLSACLIDAVAAMRLPAPGRSIPAKRVFRFRPKSGFQDELTTLGHCQAKPLRPALNPARAGLIRCVKASRPWPPPEAGAVQLRWQVGGDGRVTGVGVTPDDDARLVACLVKQVEPLAFPPEACQVRYTLRWE